MRSLLIENPLLLLFVVAAIGYPLGQIRVAGTSLGVGAVLFVGLAIGSLDPALKLPEIVYLLGLVLFVYTVGLSNGPSFFGALLRGRGLRVNAVVVLVLAVIAALVFAIHRLLGLSAPVAAGLFAGTLTNTPTLAAQIEYLHHAGIETAEPVVAYSLTYPAGVLGMILALVLARRLMPSSASAEARRSGLELLVVRIKNVDATAVPLGELIRMHEWQASFGRIKRADGTLIATPDVHLRLGDLATVVGPPDQLRRVVAWLGDVANERIDLERQQVDMRRIFVSRRDVAGRTLRELDLGGRFGAAVTRVRRGDVDFIPDEDTVIELGDRLRVLVRREAMKEVTQFLGDSYRALGEMDVLTFSLGCALGLVIGSIPFPLPGGIELRLGLAGGPLIVALVLGNLGRTGRVLWTLPYNVNLTVRQLGLILFLAGIGTRAGYDFVRYLATGSGVLVFAVGAAVTAVAATLLLWLGGALLKLPFGTLAGTLAGLQTQPAVLGFALEQTADESPNIGYATVYPVATITKVLLGQLLLAAMG